jgi:uncharacterized protein (DUF2141 family)
MSVRSRRICRAIALAVLPLAVAVPALAQLQFGDIYVKVQDEKGQPLPGATVTVSGIGAPQVETSGADGQVRFLGLHPGRYAVKGELEGFSSVDYPDITVNIGGKAQIVLTLSSAIKETITVTADAPLLDERKVTRGAVISTKDLANIPTARDPWSLLSQAPGVQADRINVGGNESGQQSNFVGVGATGRENTFAVDGVIVSDMNAVGGSATYFDFGAYDEVQFTVSSADVTVATAGVTINQVTKRGTNELKVNARYLRTDGNLQSPPGKVAEVDNNGNLVQVDGNKIDSVQEYGGDVGGPLWRDHLWGWASYGRSDIRNIVIGGQPDKTLLKDFNTKLNFQAGSADSGVIHYWTNNKLKNGRDAGPDHAPESTLDQTTPSKIWKLEDTVLLSQSLYLTGLWSNNSGAFTLTPKGGLDGFIFFDAAGTIHGSNFDFKQKATIQQERLDGSYFFNLGGASNELKFGGSYRHQDNVSGTIWPHGNLVFDCSFFACSNPNNDPDLFAVEFPRNRSVSVRSEYGSAWLQDTLTSGPWTINAGARYDNQLLKNRPVTAVGNPLAQGLIPDVTFPGNKAGGFVWNTIEPRVGITYALGEQRKTLLRGTFSQYAEQLGQLPLSTRVNPIGYSYAYFYFDDLNHNHRLDANEIPTLTYGFVNNINVADPTSLATAAVNDPHLKPTRTYEWTLGVDQGFGRDVLVTLTGTYRAISNIPETRGIIVDENGVTRLATVNDYVQPLDPTTGLPLVVSGKLPNGQMSPPIPVFALKPSLSSTGGTLYTNGDRTQRYVGGTLTFTKRLANRWSAHAHFTLSDWTWKIGPNYVRYHDPTNLLFDELFFATRNGEFFEQSQGSGNKGNVFIGGRWSYNANALYQVAPDRPWGFDMVASVTGRQGYPSPPYVKIGGSFGRRFVLLAPSATTFRNPDIFVLDGRIAKDFTFHDFGLTIGIDGFNLLDQHTTLQVQSNAAASTAENVFEVLSPRIFRIGATLHFH